VHDRFCLGGRNGVECGYAVTETALYELCALIDCHTMPLREVIEHAHLVSGIEQFLYTNRADVTGSSSDKNLHRRDNLLAGGSYPKQNQVHCQATVQRWLASGRSIAFHWVFRMKNYFFIQTAMLSMAVGCATVGAKRDQVVTPSEYEETIRVACVGDSITYGASIKDRENNNYPVVLGRSLGEKFEVRNFGVSGATLLKKGDFSYWDRPAFKAATQFNPHVVVIKLGTNDTKPQNWKHAADYAVDYEAMIDHFAALPAKPKIWLCSPAPVYQTRWGISEKSVVEEVIPKVRALAKRKGLPLIDLYTALSGKPEMFPDKIHPNAAGARVMAGAVEAAILGR